jgi:hypothetical protein
VLLLALIMTKNTVALCTVGHGIFWDIVYDLKVYHAEGLVNPKVHAQKKVTDFEYPRACRIRKHQKNNQLFSKRD